MGIGTQAAWLALGSGAIIAIVAGMFSLRGFGLSRRTELDKLYGAELNKVRDMLAAKEKECTEQAAIIYSMQQQHLADMPCFERERQLQEKVVELVESERITQARLDEFLQRMIGAKEPLSEQ